MRFVTNALDQPTEFQYEADGRRTVQISPSGKTRQSVYDARGQLFRAILPDGEFTEFVYRADGSLLTRTMPDGSVEIHAYLLADLPRTPKLEAPDRLEHGLLNASGSLGGIVKDAAAADRKALSNQASAPLKHLELRNPGLSHDLHFASILLR